MNKIVGNRQIWISLLTAVMLVSCTIEPLKPNRHREDIKGAPEWVNYGSEMVPVENDTRMFRGVSSVTLQGDMALQKSIANDRAISEVSTVLVSYLDVVSNAYLTSSRMDEGGGDWDEYKIKALEGAATRRVKEGISKQIDSAIERQFKEDVSQKFKEDIYRRIKDTSARQIRESISHQMEFSSELEDDIARQIKAAVSRQLLNTTGANLSGAKIIESWRDPQTNMIWVRAELDLKFVKNIMAGVKDLNEDLKKFIEANAEAIYDRMLKDENEESFFNFEPRE